MDLQTRRRGRARLLLQQRKEVVRPEGELLRVEKLGVAIAGEAKERKLAGGCVDGAAMGLLLEELGVVTQIHLPIEGGVERSVAVGLSHTRQSR
jgi:hypothetical protein